MVTEAEKQIKEQVEKSNLAKAFELKSELNLDLTLEQSFALNTIMCDLANQEFSKGLNKGREIANSYK